MSADPSINQSLLNILCCPETRQRVELAADSQVDAVNAAISAGRCKNRAGKIVAEKIDGALVRADKKFLYPIRMGIPVMLIDEAIPLS